MIKRPRAPSEITELKDRLEEAEKILMSVAEMPDHSIRIMRENGLQIDDLDDPMQKLAFTLHAETCEVSDRAGKWLEGGHHD